MQELNYQADGKGKEPASRRFLEKHDYFENDAKQKGGRN